MDTLEDAAVITQISLESIFERYQMEQDEVEYIMSMVAKDELTGLYNRRKYNEDSERHITKAKRNKSDLSCIIVDIDYFKKVNDNYGHEVGDKVLKEVSDILLDSVRLEDTANVYRYGGEEMVILLPETSSEDALTIAERCRTNIQDYYLAEKRDYKVTASFGVSSLADIGFDGGRLLLEADRCLYDAKKAGRNQTKVYKG